MKRGQARALVVGEVRDEAPDVDALVARLTSAEAERDRAAPRRVSRTHAERVRHSLAVIVACTDRETGAVIASPTTSLPEVVPGRRFVCGCTICAVLKPPKR